MGVTGAQVTFQIGNDHDIHIVGGTTVFAVDIFMICGDGNQLGVTAQLGWLF